MTHARRSWEGEAGRGLPGPKGSSRVQNPGLLGAPTPYCLLCLGLWVTATIYELLPSAWLTVKGFVRNSSSKLSPAVEVCHPRF